MELLSAILSEKSENLSQQQRAKWLSRLLFWFQRARSTDEKEIKWDKIYTLRLKFLVLQLRGNPEWRHNIEENLRQVLVDLMTSHQLSSAGLPEETSFFHDFFSRVQSKILPEAVFQNDLGSILKNTFDNESEIVIIDAIDENAINEFIEEVFKTNTNFTEIKEALYQSLFRMSIQLGNSSLILSNKLFRRGFANWENAEKITRQLLAYFNDKPESLNIRGLVEAVTELEKVTYRIQDNLGKMGVEIETVYTLQIQVKRIKRYRLLLNFLDPKVSFALACRLFFSELVRDIHESRGIKSFLVSNFELLSKRVVHGNSIVGEHYVAKSWEDLKIMFISALGGGLITSLTVFIRYVISLGGLSGFLKGFIDSINYSLSFLSIQLAGFTLATKQPSTTAAFLARTLAVSTRKSGLAILYILRAQMAAVFANVLAVVPICFLVSYSLQWMGTPIMSSEEAHGVLASTRIFGPTILFACFTGGLLFISSLVAGWFENFCIVTDLADRVKYNSKFSKLFGKKNTLRISEFIRENANALAANISLGFLLGLVPQLLKFMNIPLEARHVTLSSGTFASALPVVLTSNTYSAFEFANAIAGLIFIGICNLLVSFSLSLTLALTASEVPKGSLGRLLRWTGKTILRRPFVIILPERKKRIPQN